MQLRLNWEPVCRKGIPLANLVMWVRDHSSPAEYAHASWHGLQIFFQLPGRVHWGTDYVTVALKSFNDHALNRDSQVVCTEEAQTQPHFPDDRLLFQVQEISLPRLDAQEQAVA